MSSGPYAAAEQERSRHGNVFARSAEILHRQQAVILVAGQFCSRNLPRVGLGIAVALCGVRFEVLDLARFEHFARLSVDQHGLDVVAHEAVDFDVDPGVGPQDGRVHRGAFGRHLGHGRSRRQCVR